MPLRFVLRLFHRFVLVLSILTLSSLPLPSLILILSTVASTSPSRPRRRSQVLRVNRVVLGALARERGNKRHVQKHQLSRCLDGDEKNPRIEPRLPITERALYGLESVVDPFQFLERDDSQEKRSALSALFAASNRDNSFVLRTTTRTTLLGFEKKNSTSSLSVPLSFTSSLPVLRADTLPAIFAGKVTPENSACYAYGRSFNPTTRALGRQLAAMEGTEAAYATASGMAAISATLLALCDAGDLIVSSRSVYGGTFALMKDFLPRKCNIKTMFVDFNDAAAVEAAVEKFKPKVLYAETLANPTLAVADLPMLSLIAKRHGATFVVDNTFAPMAVTPVRRLDFDIFFFFFFCFFRCGRREKLQKPSPKLITPRFPTYLSTSPRPPFFLQARYGAEVVIHSLTKGISGSSDCLGGAICSSAKFVAGLMDFHSGPVMVMGPTLDAKVAAELGLRIPHLALRVREQARRAAMFAERLQAAGAAVVYPGLPSHPQHALFRRLANRGYGCGGLLTLDCGSCASASRLMERLQNRERFGLMAVSLGYHETLLSVSGASTSSELSPEERAAAGVTEGLLRVSVGITGSAEQRSEQLLRAFGAHAAAERARAKGIQPPYRAARLEAAPMVGRGGVFSSSSSSHPASSAAAASSSEGKLGETGLTRAASWDSFGDALSDCEEEEAAAGGDDGGKPPSDSSLPVSINKRSTLLPPAVAAVTDEANVLAMLSSSPASAQAFADVAAKGAALAARVGGKVKLIEGKRVLYVRANGAQQ